MTAQTYKENISGTSIGNDTLAGNGGSILAGATTLKVATTPSDTAGSDGLPATPSYDIAIGTERMTVTGVVAGTKTLTVTRGVYGTTAAAHNDGDVVDLVLTASGFLAELALKASADSPTFTGAPGAPIWATSGFGGAVAASRHVGATASGAPTTGTYAVGDFVIDQTGNFWVCTSAGTPGTWVTRTAIGCRVYNSGNISTASGVQTNLNFDSERSDTNAFHFTSAANLTGTVAKAAGSAAIVGTSTLFLTELSVNQVIAIPGTATEIGVVKAITDNTHLTLWQTMANTASGQTAARRNDFIAIPVGFAGKYLLTGTARITASSAGSARYIIITVNGNTTGRSEWTTPSATSAVVLNFSTVWALSEGDYVAFASWQDAGTLNVQVVAGESPEFAAAFLGS